MWRCLPKPIIEEKTHARRFTSTSRGRDSMAPSPHRSPSAPSLHHRISLSALCSPSPSTLSPPMTTASDAAFPVSPPSRSLDHGSRTRSGTPGSLSLDAEDESVMIAVRALGDMRSGASSSVSSSSSPVPYQNGSCTPLSLQIFVHLELR